MTFKRRFESKKLLIGSLAALSLALSVGLTAQVSAKSGVSTNPPVVASQCTHPGYMHFGFASKQACLGYVAAHAHGNVGGHGYGGNNGGNANIVVSIQNVVNAAVSVTVNIFNNFF